MNVLSKKSMEIVEPPPLSSELKAELKDLVSRISEKEAELTEIQNKLKNAVHSRYLASGFGRETSAAAAQVVVESITAQRDKAILELQALNRDFGIVEKRLKDTKVFEGKVRAESGAGEIAAKLAVLLEKTQEAIEANQEYAETRASFGRYVNPHWPFSNFRLAKDVNAAWIKDAKIFMQEKGEVAMCTVVGCTKKPAKPDFFSMCLSKYGLRDRSYVLIANAFQGACAEHCASFARG